MPASTAPSTRVPRGSPTVKVAVGLAASCQVAVATASCGSTGGQGARFSSTFLTVRPTRLVRTGRGRAGIQLQAAAASRGRIQVGTSQGASRATRASLVRGGLGARTATGTGFAGAAAASIARGRAFKGSGGAEVALGAARGQATTTINGA